MKPVKKMRGFTFVEILAAMLFMAIVIPVAVRGMLVANRIGISAERKRVAAQLAEKILNEKLATEEWRNGDDQGDFGEDRPDYKWELTTQSWEEDEMSVVTVRVTYTVQGQEYAAELSTLGDDTDPDAETDTGTTTGTQS
jgi:general secretion pathway protein I